MTRRGQNPYANPAAGSSFSQNNYTPAPPAFDSSAQRPGYPPFEERAAPSAKPFKTKGMQLGSKSKKQDSTLAEALGGLNVDDEPLLAHRQEERQEAYQEQQSQPPAPVVSTKDANPFGDVEPAESVLIGHVEMLSCRLLTLFLPLLHCQQRPLGRARTFGFATQQRRWRRLSDSQR